MRESNDTYGRPHSKAARELADAILDSLPETYAFDSMTWEAIDAFTRDKCGLTMSQMFEYAMKWKAVEDGLSVFDEPAQAARDTKGSQ